MEGERTGTEEKTRGENRKKENRGEESPTQIGLERKEQRDGARYYHPGKSRAASIFQLFYVSLTPVACFAI